MRNDLIVPMDEFNAMSKEEQIATLCTVHECDKKKRKIHARQYVFERWNPHPPQAFINWWGRQGWHETEERTRNPWQGVTAVVAFNCEKPREVYREWKSIGAPETTHPVGVTPLPQDPILGERVDDPF